MTGPKSGAVGLALCAGLAVLSGCTAADQAVGFKDRSVPSGSFQLVGFTSCDEALSGLRAAAKAMVGPYGFWGGGVALAEGGVARDSAAGAPAQAAPGVASKDSATGAAPPSYSGTNTHEAGVDEPDLVKSDGRRIITVSAGVLYVVDAARGAVSGSLDLTSENDGIRYAPADLLLFGDHALVLLNDQYYANRGLPGLGVEDRAVAPPPAGAPDVKPTGPADQPINGPRLLLVNITGRPSVLATYRIDGTMVDARQVGSTARVVIRSFPRVIFPYIEKSTDAKRMENNKKIIDRTGLDDWLPRIETTAGGSTEHARINCEAIARPSVYTGTNLLTVLTFDLAADALGAGRPTTIVADGDTVYSNGPSLYVASDQRWRVMPMRERGIVDTDVKRPEPRTEIYKFDTSSAERPRFVAGGSVPGYLINQYAMSEWDGKLRVATTTGEPWAAPDQRTTSRSGVYVLDQGRRQLKQIGHVDGLGKGERIFAVRFVGTLGYVVTFRQTDPLYTVDLRDPTRPTVRGELKISGYSAYLHPAGEDKLIGIGQEATQQGGTTGTQVSLFDVADPDKPTRLARYHLSGAHSEAEFDPHAFLYWPQDGLLVVPLQAYDAVRFPGDGSGGSSGSGTIGSPVKMMPTVGALVLRVSGDNIVEVGFITHPSSQYDNPGYPATIRRSLVIDQTLWTVSDRGLLATDSRSLARLTWIPLN
jgi:hypothetical protein